MIDPSKKRKIFFTAFLVSGLLALSGCALLRSRDTSADRVVVPHTDSATDTRHESCLRACGHDHERCNDGPASRNETFDAPQQFVGASAGCDQSLRECLKACK